MHVNESLVIAAAVEERCTFPEMVEQYQRPVYLLSLDLTGNHHDAEDLSQEVFMKAYRSFSRFRGEASLLTWLRRIAVNTYLNKRRKKALRFMRFFDDVDRSGGWAKEEPGPDVEAAGRVMRAAVEQALETLSPRERSAFVLRHYQDLAVKDVAEAMGCAEGTVKSLLHRSARKLQKTLAPYRDE